MKGAPHDAVDRILEQWQRERPELDLLAMGAFGRLGRLHAIGSKLIASTLAEHGLNLGEFDVLAALRRSGKPHRLTPTELSRNLMLSSGAMTNRIDRLEAAGLVERLQDPGDRRGTLVSLTRAGLSRVDAAVARHVGNEAQLLSALSKAEQAQLNALLRKLLLAIEPGGA
jgi:DNA-binding MarR family transcriptional regulator